MTDFRKSTHISNLIKIRPMRAEFFHADGRTDGQTDKRTDLTKLIVIFAVLRTRLKQDWTIYHSGHTGPHFESYY